uniref:Uncharacterized protein n=1 Tax=Streptomyces avermitilis TaxID=33903 RepID=A0A499VHT1_STRAX|nr:hypothetical protein SAVMC3_17400 [Streptomyces avermitilis]
MAGCHAVFPRISTLGPLDQVPVAGHNSPAAFAANVTVGTGGRGRSARVPAGFQESPPEEMPDPRAAARASTADRPVVR